MNGSVFPITCTFNSENGESIGIFGYRQIPDIASLPQNDAGWATYGTVVTDVEEDIGDMIRSNYLIIKDRNYATTNGRIVKWEAAHPEYSHYIYHNFNTALNNLSITYKNMYL